MSQTEPISLLERADLKGRSLITMRGYTPEEIELLLDAADELKALRARRVYRHQLADRSIALIFLKPSCRTRVAFAVGAADEGADVHVLSAEEIRFGVKESVADIARVLGRLVDGIAFRGYGEEIMETLAERSGVPVWNGLSDLHHPTQVLADLMTVREVFGSLEDAPIAYVGDGRNNQARSLMVAAVKLGLDVRVLAPEALQVGAAELEELRADDSARGGRLTITSDAREALAGAAVVYGDVWVSMGEEELIDERIALLRDYRVTPETLAATGRSDTIYLHCLPAFHNHETEFARAHPDVLEVDDEVFEGPRSRAFDQSENRMHTAKALMVLTIA